MSLEKLNCSSLRRSKDRGSEGKTGKSKETHPTDLADEPKDLVMF